MDIVVKAKNCEVSGKLKEEAVARVEHATRFFDQLTAVQMVFSEEHNPSIAAPAGVELTARTKGHHIRAEGSAADHRAAVDVAIARFERQLARFKARMVDRNQGRDRALPTGDGTVMAVEGAAVAMAEDPWPAPIVRRKSFEMLAMVPEDAAVQLELLGHDFYMFTNAASGAVNVVYRRKDGDLGLIQPAE